MGWKLLVWKMSTGISQFSMEAVPVIAVLMSCSCLYQVAHLEVRGETLLSIQLSSGHAWENGTGVKDKVKYSSFPIMRFERKKCFYFFFPHLPPPPLAVLHSPFFFFVPFLLFPAFFPESFCEEIPLGGSMELVL